MVTRGQHRQDVLLHYGDIEIYLRKLWLSWKPCAPTALYKLLSRRLEFPTFPNVVNKPPVKGSINLSQYFVLLPLGREPLHPSLEYLTFETCASHLPHASSHLEYTVCAHWISNYFLPSSGTLKCVWTSYTVLLYIKDFCHHQEHSSVCEHLILLYFISRNSNLQLGSFCDPGHSSWNWTISDSWDPPIEPQVLVHFVYGFYGNQTTGHRATRHRTIRHRTIRHPDI